MFLRDDFEIETRTGMAMLSASDHMSDGETIDLGTFEHHAEPPYLRQVSESSEGHHSDA